MNKKALIVLLVAAACGKKGGGAAASSITKADADAANAAVPADLKTKVVFDVRTVEDKMGHHKTKYTFVAPKSWKEGFMPGSLKPDDADNLGFATEVRVGTNCDGSCESKDWAKVVDKVYYSQYTSGKVTGKVVKDVKGKNDRLMVFANEPTVQENAGSASMTVNGQTTTTTVTATSGTKGVTIIHTWWEDGGSKHFVCEATLNEGAAVLADAFEKACAKASVED
jgi:hypothetical protein